ncbi:MAG: hypothetical protein A2Z99_19345 [Treponema sp. GWB1_62_6]|nr:MAG: hypothetical protein A2001_11810 [Treponema sp. GWC1_61_84]OHE71892.1 MAG: hypothetical protein A2413_20615 [Treponema sp. RIFOXYC1_FULL_61_9]OHE72210.1 MAG: hypothetical protein A2Z99_19345 [Treponema sp. GWB1_62_6]
MASKRYFHRVHEETPTRFWINNPTLEQARSAIDAGAVGCTTNPSYVSKLFGSPDDFKAVTRAIDMFVPYEKNDSIVAAKVQAHMVGRLSDEFMPLYRSSEGTKGFVTIQGDPFTETVARKIIDEGIDNRKIGDNVIIKIPVTEPGIEAIEFFVDRNIPTMATEVMGLPQAISICEAYKAASAKSGNKPVFYVTHITGILDDFFKNQIKEKGLAISAEAVKYAGLSVAKKEYALLKERKYPGVLLGGGARKLEDFTELVGGDLAVTINWTGTAETLIEQDKPVVPRIGAEPDAALVAELKAKLPGFNAAYEIDGMKPSEYYDYGAVELFRNSFMKGWKELVTLVAERRSAI